MMDAFLRKANEKSSAGSARPKKKLEKVITAKPITSLPTYLPTRPTPVNRALKQKEVPIPAKLADASAPKKTSTANSKAN